MADSIAEANRGLRQSKEDLRLAAAFYFAARRTRRAAGRELRAGDPSLRWVYVSFVWAVGAAVVFFVLAAVSATTALNVFVAVPVWFGAALVVLPYSLGHVIGPWWPSPLRHRYKRRGVGGLSCREQQAARCANFEPMGSSLGAHRFFCGLWASAL